MKKIKFLMPIMCVTTLSGSLPYIAGCSNTNTEFKVTINQSDTFTATQLPKQDGAYRWTFTPTEGYAVELKKTQVKINNQEYTGFWFANSMLYIPSKDITGDIEITISTKVDCCVKITSDGVLTGWNSKFTEDDIRELYGDTLNIPAKVKTIAPYAFYNKTTGKSTIPSFIKKLTFDVDKNGRTSLEGSEYDGGTPAIGEYSFYKSPIEYVDFPIDIHFDENNWSYYGRNYDIGYRAFAESSIRCVKLPHPGYRTTGDYAGYMNEYEPQDTSFSDMVSMGGLKIVGEEAFLNCKNLTSIITSPFTNEIKDNAFKFYNESNGSYEACNVNYIDDSKLLCTQLRKDGVMSEEEEFDLGISIILNMFDTSWSKWGETKTSPLNTQNISLQKEANGFYKTNQLIYYYLNYPGSQQHYVNEARVYLERIMQNWFNCSCPSIESLVTPYTIRPEQQGNNWLFSAVSNSKYLLDINPTTDSTDMYRFKDSSIEVSVSALTEDSHDLKAAAGDSSSASIVEVPMPDDIEFNITSTNWKSGTEVGLHLEQIHSEEASYRNQSYKVVCDATPTVGSEVELTVVNSTRMHDFVSNPFKLTIKFVA